MAKKPMSENARKVLAFLQAAGPGVKFTANQVKDALGLEKVGAVTGTVTGLVKKELAVRSSEVVVDDEGKEKEVKYFALTEAGAVYDPDAVVDDE